MKCTRCDGTGMILGWDACLTTCNICDGTGVIPTFTQIKINKLEEKIRLLRREEDIESHIEADILLYGFSLVKHYKDSNGVTKREQVDPNSVIFRK